MNGGGGHGARALSKDEPRTVSYSRNGRKERRQYNTGSGAYTGLLKKDRTLRLRMHHPGQVRV